ncbi:MAG: sulfur reduction protein DsrE, partial [Ekhidna sp.]
MRNLTIALTILFVTGAEIANGQSIQDAKDNYLVISKNIQQLKPIILTAQDLEKNGGQSFGEFHFLICGKTVKDIGGNEAFRELLGKARKQRIQVLVCGLSLS